MKVESYNRTSQIFHWVSALLIIGLLVFGTVMVRLDPSSPLKTTMYRSHVIIGMVTLVITLGRIVWLFVGKRPSALEMPGWEKQAFTWNHRLLYLFMLVVIFSGIGMLLQSGLSLPPTGFTPADIQDVAARQGHGIFTKVLLALFVMHVGGVFYYQFTKGDTLGRMGLRLLGRSG